jgi:deoxyribodipyrimidine photolyase-related protein
MSWPMRPETDYVKHHIKKVVAFSSMRILHDKRKWTSSSLFQITDENPQDLEKNHCHLY